MSRASSMGAALHRVLRGERFRQWRVGEGPGRAYRWCVDHPVMTTAIVAILLAAILAATFGVPPLSPLVLVILLIAPMSLWLRTERRVLDEWDRGGTTDDQKPGDDRSPRGGD